MQLVLLTDHVSNYELLQSCVQHNEINTCMVKQPFMHFKNILQLSTKCRRLSKNSKPMDCQVSPNKFAPASCKKKVWNNAHDTWQELSPFRNFITALNLRTCQLATLLFSFFMVHNAQHMKALQSFSSNWSYQVWGTIN